MNLRDLENLVREWDGTSCDDDITQTSKYEEILKHLRFLGADEWSRYLPCESGRNSKSLLERLAKWIGNASSEHDQKLLFEYAKELTFYSHDDFIALYKAAFKGPITRWVIEQAGIRLDSPDFDEALNRELHSHTWFCPATDSMDINEFYHVNNITGIEHRPIFADLRRLNPTRQEDQTLKNLKKFIKAKDSRSSHKPLKRLVLLEDFVGSGTQIKKVITWIEQCLNLEVLVVPLIICAPGLHHLSNPSSTRVKIEPTICIGSDELIGKNKSPASTCWHRNGEIESFVNTNYTEVSGGHDISPTIAPYHPHGYKQTGCSIVTYSNTPNNSLPLLHHHSDIGKWHPLFPRATRV